MKTNLNSGSQPLYNQPGEGGAAAPSAPAAPAAAASAPSATPAAAGAAAVPPAAGVVTPPAAAVDYWPEGLDPKYKGTDGKTTLDNLAKDLKGYRDRDATRGVPEKPEGYTNFEALKDFKMDPAHAPHFAALKSDPVFKGALDVMHKHGMGQLAVAETYQAFLNAAGQSGMLEPPLDIALERVAMVPDAAKNLSQPEQDAAVQKRLNDNFAFLDLAVQNRGLDAGVAKHMEFALGDSAKGQQAMEWMRAQMNAAGQQPGAHGQPGGGADTRESLRAEQATLKPSDPDYAKKSAALDEKYKALIGN
jgi:hypothetical protein